MRAVDGVSLTINEGETLGLVGESGCGKSTLCRAILQLTAPTSGSVRFAGEELVGRSRREPAADAPPDADDLPGSVRVAEPAQADRPDHRRARSNCTGWPAGATSKRRVQELLDRVGLQPEHCNRYPHEFSGGQRQRIGIARALALRPKLIIADEPVSALDVSVQAQIVNLLKDLQDEFGLSYLFVAHDLGVVRHVSDRVAVMYLGKIVEKSAARQSFTSNRSTRTRTRCCRRCRSPIPKLNAARERLVLEGDVPSPIDPPSGCHFHTRCPWATEVCTTDEPALVEHRIGTRGGLPPPAERLGAAHRLFRGVGRGVRCRVGRGVGDPSNTLTAMP